MAKPTRISGPPAELLEVSKAVAESLHALNQVTEQQRSSIAKLSEDLMRAMVSLVGEANALTATTQTTGSGSDAEALSKLADTAKAATSAALVPDQSVEPAGAETGGFKPGVEASLLNAYNNTVETQQQLNAAANAALAQGIATLYSVVAASTGKVEGEIIKTLSKAFTPDSSK